MKPRFSLVPTVGREAPSGTRVTGYCERSVNAVQLGQNTPNSVTSRRVPAKSAGNTRKIMAALLRYGRQSRAGEHQLAIDGTLRAWRRDEPSCRQVFFTQSDLHRCGDLRRFPCHGGSEPDGHHAARIRWVHRRGDSLAGRRRGCPRRCEQEMESAIDARWGVTPGHTAPDAGTV